MKKLALLALILLGMAASLARVNMVSAAADPGCYEVMAVPGVGAAVGLVNCDVFRVWVPTWQVTGPGECWTFGLSPDGVPLPNTQPEKKDCASITTNVPPNLDGNTDTVGAAQQRQSTVDNKTRTDAGLDGSGCQLTTGGQGSGCQSSGYLTTIINVLSAAVGIIVLIMIIIGGIQYSTSSGDPSKVAAAKQRILNAILALLAFLFLFAFLQWLVPGGVL